jgi:hypothetical protein
MHTVYIIPYDLVLKQLCFIPYSVLCVLYGFNGKQLLLCKQIVFVMESQCVFYKLGTECVCIIYMNFRLLRVNNFEQLN